MLFIVGTSLFSLILTLSTLDATAQILAILVIAACLFALLTLSYILYKDVTKKNITHKKFRIFPCHRDSILKAFSLCFRCTGFYTGIAFWSIITTIRPTIWANLIEHIGLFGYFVLLLVAIISVPIHGAFVRSHPSRTKKQNGLRSVIGFFFSLSLFLIAGLIIYLI